MPWRFVDNWTEFVAEFQPRDPRPLSHRFCGWDATPDLAQATWEWPAWKGCPTDQMYFWTAEWQRGERETLRALREGDHVEFDGSDPGEVASWFAS